MKKLFTFLASITFSVMLFAQAPQSFSYQTVIRDASWTVLDNQSVGIKISIREDVATGTVVYEESHSATTSQIGLVNLSIGEGTLMSGVFNTIDWGNHTYFIEVAVDVSGTYDVMGTTQLRSVPYALYAETSGTPGAVGPQGPPGIDGTDGVDGIDGTDGVDGVDGAVGATGPAGVDGTNGTNGTNGLPGTNGTNGTDGVDGIDGTNGTDGVDGIDGADGADGAVGATGSQGPIGLTGATGPAGADGVDGMDVLGTADQTLYYNGTDWIATSNLSNDGTNASTDADMNINGITVGKGGGYTFGNTASGANTLQYNTTGSSNTASGGYALQSNTTGTGNTASGKIALQSNTTGTGNTASGIGALSANTTGEYNTASGIQALYSNTTGNYNAAFGMNVLPSNTTGNYNAAFGIGALSDNTTGSNNTAIGKSANVPSATSDNQVRIGNTDITYAGIQVAWTITSDKRWKSGIQNSSLGLNFISKLRPVSYYRNNDESKKIEYGFIAQELETALNNAGARNNGIISKDDEGMYGVRYNDLIAPMVKAIQEQQEMINTLQQENKDFKERIVQLENK